MESRPQNPEFRINAENFHSWLKEFPTHLNCTFIAGNCQIIHQLIIKQAKVTVRNGSKLTSYKDYQV